MRYLDINCDVCGILFKIQPKRYNGRKKDGQELFYCSRDCYLKHRKELYKEEAECSICHTKFERSKTSKKKKKVL